MLLIQVHLIPRGDLSRKRLWSQATIDLQGIANEDDGVHRRGERWYRVRLLKGGRFGGPGPDDDPRPHAVPERQVWKEGWVRGHFPGRRGEWDLIGGALKLMLGSRLNSYRSYQPQQGGQS